MVAWLYSLAPAVCDLTREVHGIPPLPRLAGRAQSPSDHELGMAMDAMVWPAKPIAHHGRLVHARLAASYFRRIEGMDFIAIHEALGLGAVEEVHNNRPYLRSRAAERLVRAGDLDWWDLGAYPWRAFQRESRPLRWEWWTDPVATDAIRSWHAAMSDATRRAAVQLAA